MVEIPLMSTNYARAGFIPKSLDSSRVTYLFEPVALQGIPGYQSSWRYGGEVPERNRSVNFSLSDLHLNLYQVEHSFRQPKKNFCFQECRLLLKDLPLWISVRVFVLYIRIFS